MLLPDTVMNDESGTVVTLYTMSLGKHAIAETVKIGEIEACLSESSYDWSEMIDGVIVMSSTMLW